MDPKSAESPHIIAIAREAEKNLAPQKIAIGNAEVMIFPGTGTIVPLERYGDRPRRKRASVSLYEAKSFVAYVNKHLVKDRTHIFGEATEAGGSFIAVIDYHEGGTELAGNAEHTVKLTLETTPEWRRWVEFNRKLITQEAFAEFIQDNMTDIIAPDGATIIEMAQMLVAKKTVSFKSGKNLRDGAIQIQYSEEIEQAGGGSAGRRDDAMMLPERFKLGLVPFVGANGIEIEARLRFRIGEDRKLYFQYVLNRPFEVIKQAFEAARSDIESGTKLPVMLGSAKVLQPTY